MWLCVRLSVKNESLNVTVEKIQKINKNMKKTTLFFLLSTLIISSRSQTVLFSIQVSENRLCLNGTNTVTLSTNLDASRASEILRSNYRLELQRDDAMLASRPLDDFTKTDASVFESGELVINKDNAEIHLRTVSRTQDEKKKRVSKLSSEDLKNIFFSYPTLPKDCTGEWIQEHVLSLSCPEAVRVSAESGNFWLRKSQIDWEMEFQISGSFEVMVCTVHQPSECTSVRESFVVSDDCYVELKKELDMEEKEEEESVLFFSSVAITSAFVSVLTILVYLSLFYATGDVVVAKENNVVVVKKDKNVVVKEAKHVAVKKKEGKEKKKKVVVKKEDKKKVVVEKEEDKKKKVKVVENDNNNTTETKEGNIKKTPEKNEEKLETPPTSVTTKSKDIEPIPGRLSRLFSTPDPEIDENISVRRRLRVELQKQGYALEPTSDEIEKSPVLKRRRALEMKLKDSGYEL